jgi:Kdo2-lipid IVA lauroyltransferase/acyltransferase
MSKSKKDKNKFHLWAEFIPFWVFLKIVRLIPVNLANILSLIVFKLMFSVFDRKHSKRTIEHLMHAGVAENRQEAIVIAKRVYHNFSMLLVEIFKMDQVIDLDSLTVTGSESAIMEACQIGGENNIPVIIVTAHYGNWELAGSAWAHNFGIPMVSIMRKFNNPLIGECILNRRQSDIHQCVDKQGGIRGLLKALRANKTIAILADQHAATSEGVETIFFGQPCRTHSSPAILHLKTGVPIIPELTRRKPDGKGFEFVIGDLIRYTPTDDKQADINTVTQMYTTALEKLISEQPDQWMWAHRRWLNLNRKAYNPTNEPVEA